MKIVSWNVNGIVACRRKGFLKFLKAEMPDILCCQEVKVQCPLSTPGYHQFWFPAQRAKYSGTLVLTQQEPLSCLSWLGQKKFDDEGRLITLEYKDFYVVNAYVPSIHPHNTPDRPDYRFAWEKGFRKHLSSLNKPVILCGDFNATRAQIDSYPTNQKNEPDNPIFRSDVRESLDKLVSLGFVDAFRALYPDREGEYTWWGPKNKDRNENRGSRLDYFFVSGELASFIQEVQHRRDVFGSDHCPISLIIQPIENTSSISDEDLAIMWRNLDWVKLNQELWNMQKELAQAAYDRRWDQVRHLQHKIETSWPARLLAVRKVAEKKSAPGIDGVKWTTDIQKARAVQALVTRNYHALPNIYMTAKEKGKTRTLLVSTYRDRAMQMLLAFTLNPVAESMADRKSFAMRRCRSRLDASTFLKNDLSLNSNLNWVVAVDVKAFYSNVLHDWFMQNVPINKAVLREILRSDVYKNGALFSEEKGISMASPLSPILANMLLDGLQTEIYDRLYPNGHTTYANGSMIRFMDDIIVTSENKAAATVIMQIILEFLAERGLRPNPDKSFAACVSNGFDFLGRHYQRKRGVVEVTPSKASIAEVENNIHYMIENHRGTVRTLIEQVNMELTRWSKPHRTEDSYMVFRDIDVFVTEQFIEKMQKIHSRWHKDTILEKFFRKEDGHYVFVLPSDPSVRIIRLAPLDTVKHTPFKVYMNPYLDEEYFSHLQYQRNVQKSNGKYRAVWSRQNGRCFYCNQPMLPDQDVEIIEKVVGRGQQVRNLAYIHRSCAYDMTINEDNWDAEPMDLVSKLTELLENVPAEESPYWELTEFFRKTKQTTIHMHFQEIERILQDKLPWEAYCFDAFWYGDVPDVASPLWEKEGFPFSTFRLSEPEYNIAASWTSQGFAIKALHRESCTVVFRKVVKHMSGITLPKALTDQPLPDSVVYKFNKLIKEFVKENGL